MDPATNPDRNDTIIGRTFEVMKDGQWHTLADISAITGDASDKIASRIRELRMPNYGNYNVDTQQVGAYTWQYKITNVRNNIVPLRNQQAAAPVPAPSIAPSVPSQYQNTVRFLNTQTWDVEDIPEMDCSEIPCGRSTRVIAVDEDGETIHHLVTTQKTLQ